MLAGLVVLSACSPTQKRPVDSASARQAYEQRMNRLSAISTWEMDGRLAISDGKDGGSGRLTWQQDRAEISLSFRGTLGAGAWQLQADQRAARLELSDGRVFNATTLNELILTHVGWRVPVDSLTWWIKGLAAPGPWQERQLDEQGRLQMIDQGGWLVEFSSYRELQDTWLPMKITARQNEYSVKLGIKGWDLTGAMQAGQDQTGG